MLRFLFCFVFLFFVFVVVVVVGGGVAGCVVDVDDVDNGGILALIAVAVDVLMLLW